MGARSQGRSLHLLFNNLIFILVQASKKKQMIKDGLLDKYGKPNELTPADWLIKAEPLEAAAAVESASAVDNAVAPAKKVY